MTLVILVVVFVGAVIYFTAEKKSQELINQDVPPIEKKTGMKAPPEKNSIYLGVYNGSDVLFFTNELRQKDYSDKINPYLGELFTKEGSYNHFNFEKILNPKKIFSIKEPDVANAIINFKFNGLKNTVYISVVLKNEIENKIFEINLNKLSSKEVWSNERGFNKYDGARGVATIESIINDKFLTFWITDCYGCEPTTGGMVILNLDTQKEKYYKEIGDLQFNLQNNTFSYKKLAKSEVPCDDNNEGYCFANLKPAGSTIIDTLP